MDETPFSYDRLQEFLCDWTSIAGQGGGYDFVGGFLLFDALLNNLSERGLPADIESLQETGYRLTEKQLAFLRLLIERCGRGPL